MIQTTDVRPVLIIGAGIIGLTLGQFLRKTDTPFVILERDSIDAPRSQGWGLTLHWSLDHFLPNLPPDVREAIFTAQVDQTKWENDSENFLHLDLATLEPKMKVPPSRRLRVQRDRLRKVLTMGIEDKIMWGKKLENVHVTEEGVVAVLEDGSSIEGLVLVGADGSRSRVRQLVSSEPQLYHLPVRMLGMLVNMTEEEAAPLQAIDPLLFQGSLSTTGTFLYVSVFDVSTNSNSTLVGQSQTPKTYTYQLCISHPTSGPDDSLTFLSLIEVVRALSQDFHPTLRSIFHSLPATTPIKLITIADWAPVCWDNRGRITLVGDAAHAMTMFRGDGANQGILDVLELSNGLAKLYSRIQDQSRIHGEEVREVLKEYEEPMMLRARSAVLLSRQACLDAHGCGKLDDQSPVVSARIAT